MHQNFPSQKSQVNQENIPVDSRRPTTCSFSIIFKKLKSAGSTLWYGAAANQQSSTIAGEISIGTGFKATANLSRNSITNRRTSTNPALDLLGDAKTEIKNNESIIYAGNLDFNNPEDAKRFDEFTATLTPAFRK